MSNLGYPYFRNLLDLEFYYLPQYMQHMKNLIGILQNDADQVRSQVIMLSQQQQSNQITAIKDNGQGYHGFVQQLIDIMNQGNHVTNVFYSTINDATNYAEHIGYDGTQVIILAFEQYLNSTRLINEGRDYMVQVLVDASNALAQPNGQQPPGTALSSNDWGYLEGWADSVCAAHLQWRKDMKSINNELHNYFFSSTQSILGSAGLNWNKVSSYIAILNGVSNHGEYNANASTDVTSIEQSSFMAEVKSVYPDLRTQQLFAQLMLSPTGMQFAEYLLFMGKAVGPNFIRWEDLGGADKNGYITGGVSTSGGAIVLNSRDYDPNDPTAMASELIHESVESYFEVSGIRAANIFNGGMGSQHADYVADWYKGKYLQEMHTRGYINYGADGTSYGLPFKDWQKTVGGKGYKDEPESLDANEYDNVGDAWVPNVADVNTPVLGGLGDAGAELPGFYHHVHVDAIPNPMGLSRNMLTTGDMNILDPSATQGL